MAFNSDDEISLDEIMELTVYQEIMMKLLATIQRISVMLVGTLQSIHTACMKEEISITLTT